YSQRTEDNLGRLISGVDRLAQELPKRLALPEPQPAAGANDSARTVRRRSSSRSFSPIMFWAVVAAVAIVVFVSVQLTRGSKASKAPKGNAVAGAASPDAPAEPEPAGKPAEVSASADIKTKLQAAQEYTDRKDYTTAEDIYKQVLKAEPRNVDAL